MLPFTGLLLLCMLAGCGHSEADREVPRLDLGKQANERKILFIGHGYQWYAPGRNRMDHRLEMIDHDAFDEVWLGGDITARSSAQRSTMAYLDSIFDLGNPAFHWAVGNHDLEDGDPALISEYTGRPLSYTAHEDGLTMLVLNTVLDSIYEGDGEKICAEKERQWELIRSVTDTIQNSSHLVVLMHHVIWRDIFDPAWRYANLIMRTYDLRCSAGDSSGHWKNTIWPALKKVQQRGVQVFCIAGDVGQGDFSQRLKWGRSKVAGIQLLASGINNSRYIVNRDLWQQKVDEGRQDKILVLTHNPKERSLRWEFHNLCEFVHAQYEGRIPEAAELKNPVFEKKGVPQ